MCVREEKASESEKQSLVKTKADMMSNITRISVLTHRGVVMISLRLICMTEREKDRKGKGNKELNIMEGLNCTFTAVLSHSQTHTHTQIHTHTCC